MEDELEQDDRNSFEDTGEQSKSRTEHLRPWQFKPGQSGNPKGLAKGTVSLKTFAKKYIQDLNDDEKIEFMKGLDKKTVWEMAEGKPKQDTEVAIELSSKIIKLDVE